MSKKKNPRKVKASQKPTKLKKGLVPGTVLILMGGQFRGRRVVFLKQLESGLLLVTGPYAINGVPLRRVNQRFCIATSSKVEIGKSGTDITDAHFAREAKKEKKSDSGMFTADTAKEAISDEKKTAQKDADKGVKVDGDMKAYLKARFSLSANMYPHEMKF